MKKLIIFLIFIMEFSIIQAQQDTSNYFKPNWESYYFDGINIWDFEYSEVWKPSLLDEDDNPPSDSSNIEFNRSFGDFYITFFNDGYEFTCSDSLNHVKKYCKILENKFGKPHIQNDNNIEWIIDNQRKINLYYSEIPDAEGKATSIDFIWGSYAMILIQNIKAEAINKLKDDYEQSQIEQQMANLKEQEKKDREEKEKQDKEKKHEKEISERQVITVNDIIGSWIFKWQIIDVLDIWGNNKCSYSGNICTWTITNEKELEICSTYYCDYFILQGDSLILKYEYQGNKHPINFERTYIKAKK